MGDFVQNAIAHRFGVVRQHKIDRQLDALFVMPAETHGPLGPIEGEGPMAQSMSAH
jgi:hypothetical protein